MCTHIHTHSQKTSQSPTLGPTHTDMYTLVHTLTPDNGQSPAELDMHTRRTHIQAFTHLLHSDTPGDSVETRTHLGINTHSRHSTMSVYTRTYAHTPHPTRSHTNTPRPSRTCSCGHTHAVALTHTWMPTRTPTHIHARSEHTQTGARMTSVSHTPGDITHRRPPPAAPRLDRPTDPGRGRPRPTRTHKVARGPAEPAPRRAARAVTCGRPPARGLRPPSPPPSRRPAQEGRERARRRGRGRGRGEGTS